MALDTLTNVKARIGIGSVSAEDDAFLEAQINLISDVIEAYCRRRFLADDYIQTFYNSDNKVSNILDTFHYPLISVDSILEDDVLLDEDIYRINKPAGKIIRSEGAFFFATKTIVEYQAGYAEVPTPVLSVLDSVVLERWNKHSSGIDLNFGSDVQRISVPGSISIDFDYSLSNNDRKSAFGSILGNNANILDPYRSHRAIVGDDKLNYVEEAP